MKLFANRLACLLVAGAGVTGLCLRHAAAQEAVAMPIENLRLPLQFYENGAVKAQLKAETALVPPAGVIVASNVVMELFMVDGQVEAMVKAASCRYDRTRQVADSDSAVSLVKQGIMISGKGFEWSGEKARITILSDARVTFMRDLATTRSPFAAKKGGR